VVNSAELYADDMAGLVAGAAAVEDLSVRRSIARFAGAGGADTEFSYPCRMMTS